MAEENLANKPLVEAILEIRWDLKTQLNGLPVDDLYDLMVGLLFGQLADVLPHHVKLPMATIPGVAVPYQVHHQYRTAADSWPLVQIGPGVLTVNETESYTAEKFLALCSRVTMTLFSFWKENGREPSIAHVALRYVDADELGGPVSDFLKKLGIDVSFDKRIFNVDVFPTHQPLEFQLSTSFRTSKPYGLFGFSASKGQKNGREAVIWESQLFAGGDECKPFIASPEAWLSAANKACHDVFFAMIEGELKERYK